MAYQATALELNKTDNSRYIYVYKKSLEMTNCVSILGVLSPLPPTKEVTSLQDPLPPPPKSFFHRRLSKFSKVVRSRSSCPKTIVVIRVDIPKVIEVFRGKKRPPNKNLSEYYQKDQASRTYFLTDNFVAGFNGTRLILFHVIIISHLCIFKDLNIANT